jgi:hypothetical protein
LASKLEIVDATSQALNPIKSSHPAYKPQIVSALKIYRLELKGCNSLQEFLHTTPSLLLRELDNSVNKLLSPNIIRRGSNILPIHSNHVLRPNSLQTVHCDVAALLDAEDAWLAPFAIALWRELVIA